MSDCLRSFRENLSCYFLELFDDLVIRSDFVGYVLVIEMISIISVPAHRSLTGVIRDQAVFNI